MVDCESLQYSDEAVQIEVGALVQMSVERPVDLVAAEACCVHYLY